MLFCPWNFPGKNIGVGYHSLLHGPGDLLDPGIKSRYPILHAEFLPSELPGKPLG